MNKSKTLILLLFIFTAPLATAQNNFQDYELELGPFYKAPKRSVPIAYVGHDEYGFYTNYASGKTGSGSKSLVKFGYDLNIIDWVSLSSKGSGYSTKSESILMLDGSIHHFYIRTERKTPPPGQRNGMGMGKKEYPILNKSLYLQKINQKDMSLDEPILIANLPKSESAGRNLSVSFSPDSSKVALSYHLPPNEEDLGQLALTVFSRNLQILQSTKLALPFEDKLFTASKFTINNSGDFYILGKRYFDKKKERMKGAVNYNYALLKMDHQSTDLTPFPISSQGKFLSDMQISIKNSGELISAGFYSESGSNMSGGVFYIRFNEETTEVLSESFKPFDQSFLLQNMTARKAEKTKGKIDQGKDVELPYFHIDEFIVDDDGATTMIAESRNIYATSYYVYGPTGGYWVSQTHYDYDDVMVIRIDISGNITWAERVPKNQHTINDRAAFSSYSSAINDKNIFLIYNDNAKNLNYSGVGRVAPMVKGSSTMVMVSQLDTDGNIKKTALFNRGEVETKIRPALCSQISKNEVLIFGHGFNLKNQRFIRLKFK